MTVGETVPDKFTYRIKTYRPANRFIGPKTMISYANEVGQEKSKEKQDQ